MAGRIGDLFTAIGIALGNAATFIGQHPVAFVVAFSLTVLAVVLLTLYSQGIIGGGGRKNSNANYISAGNGENSSKTLLWSSDGKKWNSVNNGFESFGRFVHYYRERELWLATGADSADRSGTILWSTDGKNWNKAETGGFDFGTGDDVGGYDIIYNSYDGIWVAVGGSTQRSATIQWSADGKNWNNALSGGFNVKGVSIYYDKDDKRYLATGGDTNTDSTILYSESGKEWESVSGGTLFTTTTGGLYVSGKTS